MKWTTDGNDRQWPPATNAIAGNCVESYHRENGRQIDALDMFVHLLLGCHYYRTVPHKSFSSLNQMKWVNTGKLVTFGRKWEECWKRSSRDTTINRYRNFRAGYAHFKSAKLCQEVRIWRVRSIKRTRSPRWQRHDTITSLRHSYLPPVMYGQTAHTVPYMRVCNVHSTAKLYFNIVFATKTIRAYYASQAVNKIPFKRRKYEINVCWRFIIYFRRRQFCARHRVALLFVGRVLDFVCLPFVIVCTLLLSFYRSFIQIGYAHLRRPPPFSSSSSPSSSTSSSLLSSVDSKSFRYIALLLLLCIALSVIFLPFRWLRRRRRRLRSNSAMCAVVS